MLRDTIASRKQGVKAYRTLEETRDIGKINENAVEGQFQVELDSRWWLEKLLDKRGLSVPQGVLLIYGCLEAVRLLLFPFVLNKAPAYFLIPYTSALIGDLFVPVSLLLLHSIYKGMNRLVEDVNLYLRANKFIAPPMFISEKVLNAKNGLEKLDEGYRNRFVKPLMLDTLQKAVGLSFNRAYQVGCALIAFGIFALAMFLTLVLNIIPPSLLSIVEPGISEIALAYRLVFVYIVGFEWAIIGMVAWTLLTSWLVVIQIAGNPIGGRPFEPIKENYDSVTTLMMKISFTVAFFAAWLSPLFLYWTVVPTDPAIHQSIVALLLSVLFAMTPTIIVSIVFPIVKIHKGMDESRKRASMVKLHQLEDIKSMREADLKRYFLVQRHLIEDYKNIVSNPEWVLNASQIAQIVGSIFLPIITFIVTIYFVPH
jgi:hypothetical protein